MDAAFSPQLIEQQADHELHALLARAYSLRQNSNEDPAIDYSFTIILIGFLAAEDPVSRWFQRYVADANISVDAIYSSKSIKREDVERSIPTEVPFAQRGRFTTSAQSIFGEAIRFRDQTGSASVPLGTRHLMAAYIYGPGTHEQQLKSYGFERVRWSNSFLRLIRQLYAQDRFSDWIDIHRFQFSQEPDIGSETGERTAAMAARPLDVRSQPSVTSARLGVIRPGTPVRITSESGAWSQIDYEGQTGYVLTEYLSGPSGPIPDELLGSMAVPDQQINVRSEPNPDAAQIGTAAPGMPYKIIGQDGDWYRIEYGNQTGYIRTQDVTVTAVRTSPSDAPPRALDWLPGYDSDTRALDDLLGIDDDVRPLAMLVAARDTVPPLSIGIFGDWGSGKTFFMGRLRQRIREIGRSAQMNADIARVFYPYIVQIEFNAWHYVEGNLWASLVEHILTSLRDSQVDPAQNLEATLLNELAFSDEQRQQAATRAETIQQELKAAENELERIKKEHEEESKNLQNISARDVLEEVELSPELKDEISKLLKRLNIEAVSDQTQTLKAALAEAQAVLMRGNSFLATFDSDPGANRRRLLYLALLVLIGPAVGIVVGLVTRALGQEGIAQVSALLGGLAAAIGSAAQWIAQQSKQVSSLVGEVERANQKIEQAVEKKRAETSGEVVAAEQRLEQLKLEQVHAQQERDRQQQRIEEIQVQLEALQPGNQLARFLQDRTESTDYRKYLGIPALIRRDFERLSEYIESLNTGKKQPPGSKSASGAHINRVVLYIDDLDRCPPDRVVQVLQAVHLLLAFPLFVVVVGVDARWIAHSLRRRYPGLLVARGKGDDMPSGNGLQRGTDRQATPYDYLEKIFQIPLWLAQINDEGSRRMLRGLLHTSIPADVPTQAAPPSPEPTASGQPESPPEIVQQITQPVPDQTAAPPNQQTNTGDAAPTASEPPLRLSPQGLKIQRIELEAMEQLASILGRTPRAIKRFVNIYRLIKASIEEESEQTRFLESGDFRCVLLLLALDTGMPEIAREFYTTIQSDAAVYELAHLLNEPNRLPEKLGGIQVWSLELVRNGAWDVWGALKVEQLLKWVGPVRRYSFHQS